MGQRYLPPPTDECPTFDGDSEYHPLLDGAAYFSELAGVLRAARAGDTVLVAGFAFDPDIDLEGRPPGSPGYQPLGPWLARLAGDGVDVRLLLATRVLAASVPGPALGGFRDTALHVLELRRDPALADRILLDHAGTLLGSNHQKFVVTLVGGELRAYVGGIDLVGDRYDRTPHDTLRHKGEPWGWHDIAVRLRGPAAARVWRIFDARWREAALLPRSWFLRRGGRGLARLDSPRLVDAPGPPPPAPAVPAADTAVRVSLSLSGVRQDSVIPARRVFRRHTPRRGVHEVFDCLVSAIGAAGEYVYLEDQYLGEAVGGDARFELYPHLRAAAERGVKVILVGSGVRDPEDTGLHPFPINRWLNRDLRRKLVGPLGREHAGNVVVARIEHTTVHAKLVLVDDRFASIGSANMFSRSMVGVDAEITAAVETSTDLVRDLRVAVWADHLRAPLTAGLRADLEDTATALGMWRGDWAPVPLAWRRPDPGRGFHPTQDVVREVRYFAPGKKR